MVFHHSRDLGCRISPRANPRRLKTALKFHSDIWMPALAGLPSGTVDLAYTTHAVEAARSDHYEGLENLLPVELDTKRARLIETSVDCHLAVVSCLYRMPLDDQWDLCLVVRPPISPATTWVGVTVWTNHKRDLHGTLDHLQYVAAPSRLETICESQS